MAVITQLMMLSKFPIYLNAAQMDKSFLFKVFPFKKNVLILKRYIKKSLI